MARVTYKSLYTLVRNEIDKNLTFNSSTPQLQQLDRSLVQPLSISQNGAGSDVTANQLITAINLVLQTALPPRIVVGLTVKATDPITNSVIVNAGQGSVGGTIYTLDSAVALTVPFDSNNHVFYVNFKNNTIYIDTSKFDDRLTIAKIVVPNPGVTNLVQDTDDGSDTAYIVQYQVVTFYANENGIFEEDTVQMFRNNIGDILAETVVGNLQLSENLKISNVTGSLMMDSSSINILDSTGNNLATFNQSGVFFYNSSGIELAKFSVDEAHIGNLSIQKNAIQSRNFISGLQGFQIRDDGNVEFNNLTVRGTIYATGGTIGGFTITSTLLYGGSFATSRTVGSGSTGIIFDSAGFRGYDAVLGNTFNLPTDGSAPTFSSGVIRSVSWVLDTASVIRTSTTVGDGTSFSAGILINNTGIYGCQSNQLLANANFKALIDGTVSMSGQISATSGQIGGVTISGTSLTGGSISGTRITSAIIETNTTTPKVRIDTTGIVFQSTTAVGTYGAVGSGLSGFKYGSGTVYGTGLTASIFNTSYPIFSVLAQNALADLRFYNRSALPTNHAYQLGDLFCVNGVVKLCTTAGSPGSFSSLLHSAGAIQGSGSAGVAKQSVTVNIGGTNYKLLYDT